MEKIQDERQKKFISTFKNLREEEENDKIEFDVFLFSPYEVNKTVSKIFIAKETKKLKQSQIFNKMLDQMLDKNEKLPYTKDLSLLCEKIKHFEEEKIEDLNYIMNNMNKFRRKNSKINVNSMLDILINTPVIERSIEKTIEQYNTTNSSNIKAKSNVYSLLRKKMGFRFTSPNVKGPSFNPERSLNEEALFLLRLEKDLNLGNKLLFYDEMGINDVKIPSRIIVHK